MGYFGECCDGAAGELADESIEVLVAIPEGMVKEASRRRRQLGQSRYGLPGRGTDCAKVQAGSKTRVAAHATFEMKQRSIGYVVRFWILLHHSRFSVLDSGSLL